MLPGAYAADDDIFVGFVESTRYEPKDNDCVSHIAMHKEKNEKPPTPGEKSIIVIGDEWVHIIL